MIVTNYDGILSMDSCNFTIKAVNYLITGTHRIEGIYNPFYMVDFKNIETKEKFTVRHQVLCQKILKSQEDEKEPINR